MRGVRITIILVLVSAFLGLLVSILNPPSPKSREQNSRVTEAQVESAPPPTSSGPSSVGAYEGGSGASDSKMPNGTLNSPQNTAEQRPSAATAFSIYPGTLQTQVELALSSRSGKMAAGVARYIRDCTTNSQLLSIELSSGQSASASPELQAIRKARLEEYNRQHSACQTLAGDPHQLRLKLLEIAVESQVFGAASDAFGAGSRSPAVLKGLSSDARAGDLGAIFQIAASLHSTVGVSWEEQLVFRYALQLAAESPQLKPRAQQYLREAVLWSSWLEGLPRPRKEFDFSSLSSESRNQAKVIADTVQARR
jgi:hypothetical protein